MSLTVQERCAVKHLKKPQFIAHMQFVEGMFKAEEAEARWNRVIDNPAIKRNGIGPDTDVPVAFPRMTECIRSTMATASLSITHVVTNESDLASATKQLRFSAMARSMTDGDFEDIGGSVFPSGAASLSQREEGPQSFPTVATADAPPLAL